MKTIEAGLGVSSIGKMIKALETYKRQFENRCDTFVKRLATEGSKEASKVYGKDVTVTAVPIDNGYSIVANGRRVCFLEFGAGTKTDSGHPLAGSFTSQTGIEVRPGSYSEQNAQEFSTFGFWVFPPGNGEVYEYIEPQPGLYRAEQKIRDIVERIAKGVFK